MTIGARDLAAGDEVVERQPGPRSLPVAEPADPRREPLERHLGLGHRDPAPEPGIVGEELEDRRIRPSDVRRVAGQGGPAERPATLAEERPHEGRDEARVVERVRHARLERLRSKVVAVVEDDGAGVAEREHRPDVIGHRAHRPADVFLGHGSPQFRGVLEADLGRDVADERVVGGRLVGHDVEPLPRPGPGRLDLGGVADESDRDRLAGCGCGARPRERLVGRDGQPVDVADVEPASRPCLVDLDRQADTVVHRHRERLCAAHPPEAGRQHDAPAERSRRTAVGRARRRSRTCPGGSPASRCRSSFRRSSGRTSSGRAARGPGRHPRWPISRQGSSWRSGHGAPTRASGTRRRACRIGRARSRRPPAAGARGRSRRRRPSYGRPDRSRRRRRARRDSRRPPGRGCSSASGAPLPGPSPGT